MIREQLPKVACCFHSAQPLIQSVHHSHFAEDGGPTSVVYAAAALRHAGPYYGLMKMKNLRAPTLSNALPSTSLPPAVAAASALPAPVAPAVSLQSSSCAAAAPGGCDLDGLPGMLSSHTLPAVTVTLLMKPCAESLWADMLPLHVSLLPVCLRLPEPCAGASRPWTAVQPWPGHAPARRPELTSQQDGTQA